jgi:glutamate synthase domain-containing protein 2
VIRSDIEILATYADAFFNEHFKWSQGSDPNVGTPGFLTFHLVSRYYVKARSLEEMTKSWRTQPKFEHFRKSVEAIPTEATKEMPITRDLQENKMDMFLKISFEQLNKHSKKLVTTNTIFFGALGEFPTSVIVARLILGGTYLQGEGEGDNPKFPKLTGLPASFESILS